MQTASTILSHDVASHIGDMNGILCDGIRNQSLENRPEGRLVSTCRAIGSKLPVSEQVENGMQTASTLYTDDAVCDIGDITEVESVRVENGARRSPYSEALTLATVRERITFFNNN